jgi:hypothetical protein
MDLATFISEWHAPQEIQAPSFLLERLNTSYAPSKLLTALEAQHQQTQKISFYEMFAKWVDKKNSSAGERKCVLTVHSEETSIAYSWNDLTQRTNYLVDTWTQRGVSAESKVALYYTYGIDYLAALLASIRLQLNFTVILASTGEASLKRAIRLITQIEPSWVLSSQEALDLPSSMNTLYLEQTEKKKICNYQISNEYAPKSSLYYHPVSLKETSYQDFYTACLIDGSCILNLKATDSWCRLKSFGMDEEPYASLLALFHGCEIVHIEYESLFKSPSLLLKAQATLVGLCPKVRDLILKQNLNFPAPKSLYYDALCGYSPTWELLPKKKEFKRTTFFQTLLLGHDGGCLLASKPSQSRLFAPLFPRPALAWSIDETPDKEAFDKFYGLFNTESKLSNPIEVARFDDGWSISKTGSPLRYGQHVPISEIEEATDSLDLVIGSCLHTPKDPLSSNSCLLILLVFISPLISSVNQAALSKEIKDKIREDIGPYFSPDKIALFPIFPKCESEKTHRKWCIDQYERGLFQKKISLSEYTSLYKLRWHLNQEVKLCLNS